MLLENVRSLDEAVDEVREDRRQRAVQRDQHRLDARRERAHLRALSAPTRAWARPGGRQAPLPAALTTAEPEAAPAEPAIRQPDAPATAQVFDLTAEDDTLTLPRISTLDSLEQKLKDLERLYG
jgi:hypothetical protein